MILVKRTNGQVVPLQIRTPKKREVRKERTGRTMWFQGRKTFVVGA